jgi:hypothetical protein
VHYAADGSAAEGGPAGEEEIESPVQTMFSTEHEDARLYNVQETIVQVSAELHEQQRQANRN